MHTTTRAEQAKKLRQWASGVYTSEAAAEVLLRFQHGRFAETGWPWIIEHEGGGAWLDDEQITENSIAALSSGEQSVLQIVASLAGNGHINLGRDVAGLDRNTFDLVLAAIAHAGGSHQHSNVVIDHDAGTFRSKGVHPSLHPWPQEVAG